MTKGWESYIHSEGQKFEGGVVEFRDKLRKYAIEIGFSYEFVRNDKKSKMMGSKVVKSIMVDKIRANLNKKAIDIADEIKSDYGLDVTYRTIWYGTELAKIALHGDEANSYAQLFWFSECVMKSNPDSKIVIEFQRETHRFQRLYLVAYAIVDSENESNWRFFLRNWLKTGSYLKDQIPYLFMCCAYSRTPEMYEFNMEILRSEGSDIVAQFLEDLPKENWCMTYFNGERFGEMTNNLAESFNNWVLPLKSLPILDINDGIRMKSMA
ncbi:uncharacterized protein LOC112178244 [Rosa chinensis]|uniref:uncharacterized protein LOC112178244 n=1 Tax=Rosa chinensis TaxID=74649 RepID=UPI000D094655|nr:uncharacterized protein LOC112178244 [Rosa chinensis]